MARPIDPDDPLAAVRERLTRLLPGRPRSGEEPDATYQVAEKKAVLDASPVEPAEPARGGAPATRADVSLSAAIDWTTDQIPIVPAPLGRSRRTPQPPAEQERPAPAPVAGAVPAVWAMPEPEPVPEPGFTPAAEAAAEVAPAAEAVPGVVLGPQALAAAPEPGPVPRVVPEPQALAAAPNPLVPPFPSLRDTSTVEPAPGPPATSRWRRPGATAPEDMLQAPPSAGVTVDDFFDGLVQRVEGDR